MKKSKLIVHELALKEKCAEFNNLLYKSKRSYLHDVINECNATKKLYQVMNQFIMSKSSNHLASSNSQFKSSKNICKIFPQQNNQYSLVLGQQSSINFAESACFSGAKFDEFLPVSNTQVSSILQAASSILFLLLF